MDGSALSESIEACLNNGKRLLEEAEWLSYDPSPTAFALTVLAQEEYAKAFLLILVRENALPWTLEVRRSLCSHECKHLMGIVMDWLFPSLDDAFRRSSASANGLPRDEFTADVANAINIYRHEKIERLRGQWCPKEPEWSGLARKMAEGMLDREKQASFYVRIGRRGEVTSIPNVSKERLSTELERARRYGEFADDAHARVVLSRSEYKWLQGALKAVFTSLAACDEGANTIREHTDNS